MPKDRRPARILAMQALCQWEVQKDESPDALAEFLSSVVNGEASPEAIEYATDLVRGVWANRQAIDEFIASATKKWELSRISTVERNVMRVSIFEMLEGKAPSKVVLNEAIEIGREYGGADSPRFINGVLDVILKRVQQEQKDGN
jgi:N utilization substance protein B